MMFCASWSMAWISLGSIPTHLDFPIYWPLSGLFLACIIKYGPEALPFLLAGALCGLGRDLNGADCLHLLVETVLYCLVARGLKNRVTEKVNIRNTIIFILGVFMISFATAAVSIGLARMLSIDSMFFQTENRWMFLLSEVIGLLTVTPAVLLLLKRDIKSIFQKITVYHVLIFAFEISIFIFQSGIESSDVTRQAVSVALLIPVTLWACLYLDFEFICFLVFLYSCITSIEIFFTYNKLPTSGDFLILAQIKMYARAISLLLFGAMRHEQEESGQRVLKAQNATLISLANLAELRDDDTGMHILRTQKYVHLLASWLRDNRQYPFSDRFIDRLWRTAPLHDIGKVGINDNILRKPGRLTPDEFEAMKTHTTIGYEALVKTQKMLGHDSLLEVAKQVAYTHHERWDGSGYPKGLRGREIPVSGRIMAVADVYDALRSKRVYKPAMNHEQAFKIIRQGRGGHFDPDVVDAFTALNQQFKFISEKAEILENNCGVSGQAE